MRFLRRIASILGLIRDESHEASEEEDEDRGRKEDARARGPAKGFGVQVPVAADRAHSTPLIGRCTLGQGGVQGLLWHAKRLGIDEDGDIADEFIDEVHPVVSVSNSERVLPKFQVKHNTRPARVKSQLVSADGTIHQTVEFRGKLKWV